jgi:hypothetical protein
MSKTKIPTDGLALHAYQHLQRVLAGLNDDARRTANARLEAGGAYEVRVCMEVNTKPCITLVVIDDECEEHQLHTVGGEPDK